METRALFFFCHDYISKKGKTMSKSLFWTILVLFGTVVTQLIDQKAEDERIKEAVDEALSERGIV